MAEQTVYRWIDENGVIHLSDEPPEGVEAEEIAVSDLQPKVSDDKDPASKPMMQARVPLPTPKEIPFGDMSLTELDAGCDEAREAERCKSEDGADSSDCEQSASEGDDPPECVQLQQELERRNSER